MEFTLLPCVDAAAPAVFGFVFRLGMPQAAAKRKDKTCVCFYSFFYRNFGHLFAMHVSPLCVFVILIILSEQ